MNQLKYVCISDFHLGAPNSILTAVQPEVVRARIQPNPVETTPSLKAFGDAMFDFLPAISDPRNPPTLVLLGDVLDLGFSPPNVAVMAFQRLVETLFPEKRPPLFAKDIIFLPGNHDHSLWHHGKMEHFLNQVRAAKTKNVPPLVHTTAMMDQPSIACTLLTELINDYTGTSDYTVNISYPTLGAENDQRAVFLHHGHFIESTYRLMSDLGQALIGQKGDQVDISEIERLNGTWIDFCWCGLGEPGDNAYSLYSLMQDPAALHTYTSVLAERLQKSFATYLPMSGLVSVRETELAVVKGLLDAVVGRNAELERNSYRNVLSGDSLRGLKWYVDQLISHDFHAETDKHLPDDVSFIFGHTHKPFEDQLVLDRHDLPVKVYNTGGWVLDMPDLAATQGASMVLIDDDLRVGALRLFNSPINGDMNPVQVKGVGGFPDDTNPFLGFLRDQLGKHRPAWAGFTDAVKHDIEHRVRLMQQQYFDPVNSVAVAPR